MELLVSILATSHVLNKSLAVRFNACKETQSGPKSGKSPRGANLQDLPFTLWSPQGRSQDLVSGGGHPFRGGPDPLFFASDPKSQGSPLMYFWLPPDFGGGAGPPAPPPPPPGYALGSPL